MLSYYLLSQHQEAVIHLRFCLLGSLPHKPSLCGSRGSQDFTLTCATTSGLVRVSPTLQPPMADMDHSSIKGSEGWVGPAPPTHYLLVVALRTIDTTKSFLLQIFFFFPSASHSWWLIHFPFNNSYKETHRNVAISIYLVDSLYVLRKSWNAL